MNRLWVVLALVVTSSASAASWESFPLRQNGSIAVWTVAGPLPNAHLMQHAEHCFGYYKDYLKDAGGETAAVPTANDRIVFGQGQAVAWKTTFSAPSGLLNYIHIFKVSKQAPGVAYAFCELVSDNRQKITLAIRSNDGVRVWLNDKMVHDHHVGRTIDQAEDRVSVTLAKGKNRLLVKVDQSAADWGLLLRVVGDKDRAAKGVRSAVSTQAGLAGKVLGATFSGSPVVLKTPEGQRQVITAHIISGGLDDATCEIRKADWPKPHVFPLGALAPGEHRIELKVPMLDKAGPVRVVLQFGDNKMELADVRLPKPRKWMVYLVQHVHTDIGYTRPQTEILPEHLRYIDYALDYCDLTDDYPDDARFRWTCEITWAVREYLNRRPKVQIERLKRRIAEGRIEIAGMFLNMSEIATETSLAASLQPIRPIAERLGAPIRTTMQNDVNGAGWCLVDYFQDIGIKYLTMGINRTRSLLPFDKPTPFWWESPSGKRILAFRADHYHSGNFWKIHEGNMAAFEPGFLDYLESLEKRNYPFDQVSIQYSGYHTDNSPPAMKECDLIRDWNEKYAWPKLRSACAFEFLQEIETHHADKLPVHRQAWPDWWTDGFGSAARETAASRQTHTAMQINQTLLAMGRLLGGKLSDGVMTRVNGVHENLLFYDEHTYGASMSINDPMCENTMVQWAEKGAYVWEAVKQAAMLREESLGAVQPFLPRADVPTIAVFNTLNWPRSGLVEVFIDDEILPRDKGFRIVEAAGGEAIPAQPLRSRSEGTYWALWAKDVPPLGYKSYRIEVGNEKPAPPTKLDAKQHTLENRFYTLTIDPKTGGVTSLIDKQIDTEAGRQLVDPKAEWHCGQLFYETLAGGRNLRPGGFKRTGPSNVRLLPGSDGPIWKSVLVRADLDGCAKGKGVRAEIRLYETEKRIEFHFAIRKLPLTRPEAVYVAFPFAWPEGQIDYEAQGSIVRPGRDQIPGSASDWQTVQSFLAVRSNDGQIIWGSDQVPLVQLGGLNLGKWQPITKIEKPHVYSWVMNNYWFTNFRATQEGEFRFSYYLTTTKNTGNTQATRFGQGSRIGLIPRVLPPGKTTGAKPALSILKPDAANVLLVSARPALYGDGVILHLRELDGKAATLRLSNLPGAAKVKAVAEVNVLEEPLKPAGPSLSFAPYETKFVKLTLSP